MAQLNQIMASTFDSIYETDNPLHRPLIEILEDMKNPDDDLKRRIKAVRAAKTPELQANLKVRLLPILTPSGTFSKRADSSLIQYNGVICLDLDDTTSPRDIKLMAKASEHTLAVMLSPGGAGLKVFILTDLTNPDRHSDAYHYLGAKLGYKGRIDLKFDPSCSNPSRACFFSVDQAMYINREAKPFHIDLASLPVYTTPSKVTATSPKTTVKSDLLLERPVFPDPLTDQGEIMSAIVDAHTLFENYHSVYPGVRNNNLYVLAFFFRLDGIPEDVATDYLVAYYVDPTGGFTADEIKRTVRSAYSR